MHVEYAHAGGFDQMSERMQRMEAKMLMIYLVKCSLLNEVFRPVHFKNERPVVPDELRDPFEDILEWVGMGEYVIRRNHFCLPIGRQNIICCL